MPALHKLLAALLLLLAGLAPVIAAPDLDVAYIARTPRYEKYQVTEEGGLDPLDSGLSKMHLAPGQESIQRWPKKGELVTFTAVVKNMGDVPTGSFSYKWYFDGKEVKSGTLESIKPGENTTTTYQWKWDSEWNDHNIKFVVDPDNAIKENLETNNSREDPTNAFCFRIHVWQSVYDWFRTEATKMNPNIAGFDDWAQNQMVAINNMFKSAIYPSTPNGILERVRLDEIVVEPNDAQDKDPNACHAPMNLEWDCRWGFSPKEYPKIFIEEVPQFINEPYSWVMHEWGHQMGKIDVYQLFLEKDRNHVQPYGHIVTPSNDLMTDTKQLHYSEMHASVFNYELHKRRGYFGEYQFDLPRTCRVRILDAYGKPIPNAQIKFYEDHGHEVNAPEDFAGTADASGCFAMPNRTVHGEITTGTGHVMHDNPWGLFHLAGFNSLFFCDIRAEGQTDYQYIEVLPFNMAFRSGSKDSYTYDVRTTIVPGGRVTTNNLMGIKMISAENGYAVGAAGTILQWDGAKWSQIPSPVGQCLYAIDADTSTGFACAVGGAGIVITCTNGVWAKRNLGSGANLSACAVASPTTILVGGDRGELYRSTDSGETWSRIEATDSLIKSISFASPNKGIMVCDGGKAYYTTDGGETWTKSDAELKFKPFAGWGVNGPVVTVALTDCCMSSETEAFACCEQGAVFKSTDGGKTWKLYDELVKHEPLLAIDIKAGGNGWSAGAYNRFYDTVPIKRLMNGMWSNEAVTTFGASDFVYDISCVNGDDGWLVGKGGLILHVQGIKYAPVIPNGQPK
jgi:photosystem II stability/assembly factor-like uncharacterized protein